MINNNWWAEQKEKLEKEIDDIKTSWKFLKRNGLKNAEELGHCIFINPIDYGLNYNFQDFLFKLLNESKAQRDKELKEIKEKLMQEIQYDFVHNPKIQRKTLEIIDKIFGEYEK